ncbi:MAG: hypothetical protein WDO18_20765 [Acidobacteriota bacterium]
MRDTPPPLSQTSSDVSGVVQAAEIKSTPLNGRHWQGLLALAPGAINTGTETRAVFGLQAAQPTTT